MIKRIGEKEIFKTKLFTIKDIALTSQQGTVTFQIIEKKDTALIVPVTQSGELLLINEYFAAIDTYALSLPKGRIETNDDVLYTANKELQEEIGYKANKLDKLGVITMSPGYLTQKTHVFLAQDLVASKLPGDEIEAVTVVRIPFADFEKLIDEKKITEARVISALYLANKALKKTPQ